MRTGSFKRVMLFVAVNLLVILTLSVVMALLGIKPYLARQGLDYSALLAFCAVFGFGGAIISLLISRWVARMTLGVQLIDPENPGGREEAALVNMIRDLCDRAGMRTLPWIGIYQSPEANAFATGSGKNRALVAVSSGLLQGMDARAVKAVLAHEVTHITNGDMVTMTLLQGIVNTFVMFLARVGAFAIDQALRSRDRDGRSGGLGYMGHYLLVMALEAVLMILAMPVIFAFSRWREYRADAGAGELDSRANMIHALRSLKSVADIRDDRAPALATMKINGHDKGVIALLYSSHPPIEKRIKALEG
jgi:heat shock protein HtpX